MAEISAIDQTNPGDQALTVKKWEHLTADNNIGRPIEVTPHEERSVQVSGDFQGAGLPLEGSNDGENWEQLYSQFNTPLIFKEPMISSIPVATRYIRLGELINPVEGTDITVTLFFLRR